MIEDAQKTTHTESTAVTDGGFDGIVKTAVKTLYLCVITLALVLVMFTLLFPLSAMRFYDDLGNNGRAYACADRAASIEKGEDKVTAMLYRVNYGAELFDDRPTVYADELYYASSQFLSNGACLERATAVDKYNLENASKALHPNLYSYCSYVAELKAKAAYRLGNTEELIGLQSELTVAPSLMDKAQRLASIAAVYYEAYLAGDELALYDEELLASQAGDYYDEVVQSIDDVPTLEQLFLLKSYEKLASRYALASNKFDLSTVSYGGEELSIGALYQSLLIKYCK